MTQIGDRVEFLGFGEHDPYSTLQPGTLGTVTLIDDVGTVHVKWDDGRALGLVTQRPSWAPAAARFVPDRFRIVGS
jgi:Domain of unknown function (DUF4314)